MNGESRPDPDGAAMGTLVRIAGGLLTAANGGGAPSLEGARQAVRAAVARDPLDSLLVAVLGGAYLFYLAEKDANPKVQTYWDALVFISTNLSVGYSDIFARTPSGKAIAAFMMTVGPSLTAHAFDPPAAEQASAAAASAATQQAIVERLDAILAALRSPPEQAAHE